MKIVTKAEQCQELTCENIDLDEFNGYLYKIITSDE